MSDAERSRGRPEPDEREDQPRPGAPTDPDASGHTAADNGAALAEGRPESLVERFRAEYRAALAAAFRHRKLTAEAKQAETEAIERQGRVNMILELHPELRVELDALTAQDDAPES